MDIFNDVLNALKNKGTELDTDSTTGSYGNIDAEGVTPDAPKEDKLILYLDSGVEIHIPTSVYQLMAGAMAGEAEGAEVVDTTADLGGCGGGGLGKGLKDGTGPLMPDEGEETEESEESDDDNKKDCPFKKEKSDDDKSENDEDDEDDDKKEED